MEDGVRVELRVRPTPEAEARAVFVNCVLEYGVAVSGLARRMGAAGPDGNAKLAEGEDADELTYDEGSAMAQLVSHRLAAVLAAHDAAVAAARQGGRP